MLRQESILMLTVVGGPDIRDVMLLCECRGPVVVASSDSLNDDFGVGLGRDDQGHRADHC